ncbi:MAG: pilin [bacterium]|nr:pilin [bacterium]
MDWGNCLDPNGVATISCIPILIENILIAALAFGGVVAAFFIIWGGIKYIRSGGDPKQADNARQTITYAIIGLIIVMLAYFIISFVSSVTGLTCLKTFSLTDCGAQTTETPQPNRDYGCFYGEVLNGTTDLSTDRKCYLKQEGGNNPATAKTWFTGTNAEAACDTYCQALP